MRCKVNGCFRDSENGICDKCKLRLIKANKSRKTIKKVSKNNYPKLLRQAKAAFQKLRRLQEADLNGIVKCAHGRLLHWSKCDGGHYYPAHYLNTCFNHSNVHPQEKDKNMDMNNPEVQQEYRDFLIKKIGIKEVEKLDQTYKLPKKISTIELEAMIEYFNEQIEKEQKRINGN